MIIFTISNYYSRSAEWHHAEKQIGMALLGIIIRLTKIVNTKVHKVHTCCDDTTLVLPSVISDKTRCRCLRSLHVQSTYICKFSAFAVQQFLYTHVTTVPNITRLQCGVYACRLTTMKHNMQSRVARPLFLLYAGDRKRVW